MLSLSTAGEESILEAVAKVQIMFPLLLFSARKFPSAQPIYIVLPSLLILGDECTAAPNFVLHFNTPVLLTAYTYPSSDPKNMSMATSGDDKIWFPADLKFCKKLPCFIPWILYD